MYQKTRCLAIMLAFVVFLLHVDELKAKVKGISTRQILPPPVTSWDGQRAKSGLSSIVAAVSRPVYIEAIG
ncbi:hypothetical protein F4823DRAFT_614559 [Ustulina deusta]|nr:hypothetical protein F4823DRAFT_614559 [Ustulina deusta]